MEADNPPETLKPFFLRATEAQERLGRLEAALASTEIDIPDAKLVEKITQLESKLEEANAKAKEDQSKMKELTTENEKKSYRIKHLVRELNDADEKLEAALPSTTIVIPDDKLVEETTQLRLNVEEVNDKVKESTTELLMNRILRKSQ